MKTAEVKNKIKMNASDDIFVKLYPDDSQLAYQKKRYVAAIDEYIKLFGENDIEIFSAPGRSEICGNHTDHQRGKVLAAAVDLDAIAVVSRNSNDAIELVSDGYGKISISLNELAVNEHEKGSSVSLIKGIAAAFKSRGYKVGGFTAYLSSDVTSGAGLSSSACFEVLIGTILSYLYNNGCVSGIEIAQIGQYAENVYFGKPCGLMDQTACSLGGLVYIDFKNADEPIVKQLPGNPVKEGYCLCVTDTGSSHAELTDEYAFITKEMSKIAGFFGKEVLAQINEEDFYSSIKKLREEFGDRAVLRSIHFLEENKRVDIAADALSEENINLFLQQIEASGKSSFQYLQNVYSHKDVKNQGLSLALAISDTCLKENGVCRVHGGGFAGTIQAFVREEYVKKYREKIESVFGENTCKVLHIRAVGGTKVF